METSNLPQDNVVQHRKSDELSGQIDSDSELSDDGHATTDRGRSGPDSTGSWRRFPVDKETWGTTTRSFGRAPSRDFASTHTGPKGVLSDYKAKKQYETEAKRCWSKEQERTKGLHRVIEGATVTSIEDFTAHSEDECDDSGLEEDAFLVQYTQLRVKEMRDAARRCDVHGALEYITPEQFLTLTSDTMKPPGSRSMLVHLYDSDNDACCLLNTQLEVLARKLVHVKFAAMMAKEADASIAMADLPVMLVFCNQQQQEAIVDVTRRLSGEFTLERVEAFVNEMLEL
uniref:Phosducin domain-containing protein n=1 Tax=Peronospora matthiolae TaxID=2874970 RepID=A0AAV1TZ89_9STRA